MGWDSGEGLALGLGDGLGDGPVSGVSVSFVAPKTPHA